MKFARYLQDTQAPEWKKAYIDYRGLKQMIASIADEARKSGSDELQHRRPVLSDVQLHPDFPTGSDISSSSQLPAPEHARIISTREPKDPVSFQLPRELVRDFLNLPADSEPHASPSVKSWRSSISQAAPRPISLQTLSTAFWAGTAGDDSQNRRSSVQSSMRSNPLDPLPLEKLLPQLSFKEAKFFAKLDAELRKVQAFYTDREAEMQARWMALREQLGELEDHMKIIEAARPDKSESRFSFLHHLTDKRAFLNQENTRPSTQDPEAITVELSSVITLGYETEKKINLYGPTSKVGLARSRSDSDDYYIAKKKLKKAVLEHYRGLEVLHNYRILNITGFRKAVKKFEKVTKILVQGQYMTERVEKSSIGSATRVCDMMAEIQHMYATLYVRGDKKKAMNVLRAAGTRVKSHHFSTWRSGMFLGSALPMLISGLQRSLQIQTREAIPGWEGLMFVYGVFAIPALYGLLLGLNFLVWARSSINYVFVFELDTSTRIDYRQYFEIPSIIFSSLCYAFWMSIFQIGPPGMWPLVWLAVVVAILFNPFHLLSKPSRFWLLRKVGKLLLSGIWHVEFPDFWLGDQFASLIFTLSNLYVVGCVYGHQFQGGFNDGWHRCSLPTSHWPAIWAFASLPLLVRLVQCIRRFMDSGHNMHIINGGKYGTGIISYLFFYLWREDGSYGAMFGFYCCFNAFYSVYSLSWDFLMDWSLFQRDSRYPLLRKELVYCTQVYYIAIVLNILLKFSWLIYLPLSGPGFYVRAFFCAMLEMVRRWLWNFFRVENEHLGNVEQYRVTREVPLPYLLN